MAVAIDWFQMSVWPEVSQSEPLHWIFCWNVGGNILVPFLRWCWVRWSVTGAAGSRPAAVRVELGGRGAATEKQRDGERRVSEDISPK